MTTTIHYEVHVKGKPLRLEKTSNIDYDCCGEYTYSLTNYENDEIFKLSTEKSIKTFINNSDIPWYNSDENRPQWRNFKLEDMTFVKVTTTRVEEPYQVKK